MKWKFLLVYQKKDTENFFSNNVWCLAILEWEKKGFPLARTYIENKINVAGLIIQM